MASSKKKANPSKVHKSKKMMKYSELVTGWHLDYDELDKILKDKKIHTEDLIARTIILNELDDNPVMAEKHMIDNADQNLKKNYRAYKAQFKAEAMKTLIHNLVESYYLILALKKLDHKRLDALSDDFLQAYILSLLEIKRNEDFQLNMVTQIEALLDYLCNPKPEPYSDEPYEKPKPYTYELIIQKKMRGQLFDLESIRTKGSRTFLVDERSRHFFEEPTAGKVKDIDYYQQNHPEELREAMNEFLSTRDNIRFKELLDSKIAAKGGSPEKPQ